MKILTEKGQQDFRSWVQQVEAGAENRLSPPIHLLEDGSDSFDFPVESKLPVFKASADITKMNLAEKLLPLLTELLNSNLDQGKHGAVYDTLALRYFPQISPPKGTKLSAIEFYCYDDEWDRFYKHRIYGPYALVSCGGSENLKPFFQKPPYVLGEYESNVGSRLHIARNPEILKSLRNIYESDQGGTKKGFANTASFIRWDGTPKTKGTPGTIRRIGEVTNQLARIYDIYDVDASAYLSLLPPEFAEMRDE